MSQNLTTVPYTKPLLPSLSRVQQLIEEVWKSGILTNFGPKEQEFEKRLQPVLGGSGVLGVSSGYTALRLMLSLLEPSGEVVVSSFTHAATAQAVYSAGMQVSFADIGRDLNVDLASVDAAVNKSTRAILATHTFGNPADVLGLQQVADHHNVALLFDGAAAVGVQFAGRPLGDYGTATAFSFHATKLLSTAEGGAVAATIPSNLAIMRERSNFGMRPGFAADPRGMNAKLNEISSALGIAGLEVLANEIARRREVRNQYEFLLQHVSEVKFVEGEASNVTHHNNAYVPIRIRDTHNRALATPLGRHLRNRGIECRRYFADQYAVDIADTYAPRAREAREDTLCLPIWGLMSEDQVALVSSEVRKFLNRQSTK